MQNCVFVNVFTSQWDKCKPNIFKWSQQLWISPNSALQLLLTDDQVPPINQTSWDQLLRNSVSGVWVGHVERRTWDRRLFFFTHERREGSSWQVLPLPGMNSNLMSLSSFLGFLSLRTRLMGMLALAAAGSCNSTAMKICTFFSGLQFYFTVFHMLLTCLGLFFTWAVGACEGLTIWACDGMSSPVCPTLAGLSCAGPGGCRLPDAPSVGWKI